jgi:hypothetical protein
MRACLLLAVAACSSSKYEPPPAPPPPSPLDGFAEHLRAEPPDVFMAAAALKEAGAVTPQATDALLAAWPRIEARELDLAKRSGTERAQGKARDNCRECVIFGEAMDVVAPKEPRLAAVWTALKPKLAAAEEAAYQAEAGDKRPRVIVWGTAGDGAIGAELVADCVTDALQKTYPDHKWLTQWQPPDEGVASVELTAAVATDDYVDSRTHQHAVSLASGLKVALVPHALPAKLALSPLEVSASVRSPSEIKSDLNVAPTMEATRTGMGQIDELREQACTKIADALKLHHAAR